MSDLETLLEVQDLDLELDRHQRRAQQLPQRQALADAVRTIGELEESYQQAAAEAATASSYQRRLEDELGSQNSKIAEADRHLYSGEVTSPKELQALQANLDSLRRHGSRIEDDLLNAMEVREPLDEAAAELLARLTSARAMRDQAEADLKEATDSILQSAMQVKKHRDELAKSVPSQLMGAYANTRQRLGGVALARLVGSQCSGCHLSLPAAEVSRIHREHLVATNCDECGRILVP